MREIVSPLSGIRSPISRVDPYKAAGFRPALVADMSKDYFRNVSRQTFDDIFTTSRLGNATMVDSDGLLKWAPHNLLTYSEDFSNAAWTKLGVSVSGSTVTAASGSSTHRVSKISGLSGVILSVEVTASAGTHSYFQIYDGASLQNYATFDLSNGTVGASGSNTTASVVSNSDGSYTCKVLYGLANPANGNTLIGLTETASSGWGNSWTSAGTETITLHYATSYRSDLGGMAPVPSDARVAGSTTYVPTTSTAKHLPRRHNHTYNGTAWVDAGTLIETEARTNLVPNSNNLSSTTNATEALNSGASPSGEDDAILISNSAVGASTFHYYYQSLSLAQSTTYTLSCYVKYQSGSGWVWLLGETGSDQFAFFNIQSGTVGATTNFDSVAIEDVGNGWYRISATFTKTSASATEQVGIGLTIADSARNWDSTGVANQEQVLVYGFQLEAASTPSSYIPTSGSTDIRAADSPLTIAGADVPWPTPTVIGDELVTNGTFDTDSDWTKHAGWTISGGIASCDGTQSTTSYFFQECLTVGKLVRVTVNVTDITSGTPRLQLGNASPSTNLILGENETVGVVSGNENLIFSALVGSQYSIDNISVKEINPLSVCIQMDGDMTYADEDTTNQARIISWELNASNHIILFLDTGSTRTGNMKFWQKESGVTDQLVGSIESGYTPGINVPFNIASRHGSTFINGAVDGTALTENTTPVALPDLSSTDLQIAYDFMGNVKQVRIWVVDIGDTGLEEASS